MKTSHRLSLTAALILSTAAAATAAPVPDDATLRRQILASEPGISESVVDGNLMAAFRTTAANPDDMNGQLALGRAMAERGLWNLLSETSYFLRLKAGKERIMTWWLSMAAARGTGKDEAAARLAGQALDAHPWNRWAWRSQIGTETPTHPWRDALDTSPVPAPRETVTDDERFARVARATACVRTGAELSRALNACKDTAADPATFGLANEPAERPAALERAIATTRERGLLPAWFLPPSCTLGGGFDSTGMPAAFCHVHGTHYAGIRESFPAAPPLLSAVTVDDAVLGRAARSGDPVVRLGALEVLMRRDRTPAAGDAAAAAWVLASSPGRNFRLHALARILDGLRCNPMANPELTKVLDETSRDGEADVRVLAALCLTWLDGRPRVLDEAQMAVARGLHELVGSSGVGAPDLEDLWRLSRAGGKGSLKGDRTEP